MIIILPIGHEQLTLSRLPYATFVLIALCITATLIASAFTGEEAEGERALRELQAYYQGHDYLELTPEVTADLPQRERELAEHRREWLAWLAEDPDGVAAYVKSTPVDKRRKGVVSTLDATGQVVEKRPDEGPPPALDEKQLATLKAEFLARAAAVDADTKSEEQSHLDDLVERYVSAIASSPARRFAYVPASPSPIGLVTHIFIHAGVVHLLLNMVFLWIVATKLEDLWGRPLFVAAFVVLGVIAALVHGLAHPGSNVPMVGASGAVAGLMGAYVVRLARTKVRFVYIYMILKPRFGSFDAPAFLMFPLWFFGELMYALFLDFGGIAYWAHVGGFVAGVVLAVALKLTDFERRVLGREPEVEVDPDAAPLVAFQRSAPSGPASPGTGHPALALGPVTIEALEPDRLTCARTDGAPFDLGRGEVTLLAAAQVNQIGGPLADQWLGTAEPRTGTIVLLVLLVVRDPDAPVTGYVVDVSKLRYNRLFERPLATPRDNFFALLKRVIALFPAARFVGDRERLAAGELPTFLDLGELEARLIRAAT